MVALVFALAVIGGFLADRLFESRALPVRETVVVIPAGATAREVGADLAARGIVRSALAFDVLARLTASAPSIKAGEFDFAPHLRLVDVLREVTGVGRQVATWVTVPEGFTAKQVARTLADRGIGDYDTFAHAFLTTSLDVDGRYTRSLEGYLFPDTYLVPEHASPATVIKLMTDKFFSELPRDAPERARKLGYSVAQIVTIASLVEREAKADDERALMAGVYYNRLRRGMPLEVDASIEYTFAHHKDVITFADLATRSPYNTYKHAGLPPTPIANPGRPSLLAAFYPQKSDYYYYVYKGNGHSAFARTLAEHEANVAKYLH
jgi:UPF0755 protein